MNLFSRLKVALAPATLVALAACSHGVQIAQHAEDYNRTVETAENSMLLLNIVRAAKGYPMHFTRISSINSNLESTIQASPQLPLGSNGQESYLNGLLLRTASKPSIAFEVLDGQKFFNGILAPVSDQTFDLFQHQGWDIPTLMNVFVERLTVYEHTDGKQGEFVCEIVNDPEDPASFAAFNAFVELADGNLTPNAEPVASNFGPSLSKSVIANAEALLQLKGTGLKLVESGDGNTFQLQTSGTRESYRLDTVAISKEKLQSLRVAQNVRRRNAGNDAKAQARAKRGCTSDDVSQLSLGEAEGENADTSGVQQKLVAIATLRSAQSMLFYLGELTRIDIAPKKRISADELAQLRSTGANRYWEVAAGGLTSSAVRVAHNRVTYTIPEGVDSTLSTLKMLSLVRQVFALHVESPKAPEGPTTLRLIN